jgi:hypothetical protein
MHNNILKFAIMKNLKKQSIGLKCFKLLLFILLLGNVSLAQHYTTVWSNNPYQAMNIIVDSAFLDGGNLQLNDEIAVFDVDASGNELCVGVIAMVGEFTPDTNYIVIASTDDPTTPEMDGFIPGHPIIYRYWDNSEAEEYVLIEAGYNPGFSTVYTSLGTAIAGLDGYTALTWTGTSNNSWNNTANWNLTQLPDTATNVVIPTGLTNYPTLSAAGECKDLTIQSDNTGDASILGDNLLTVDRNVTVERYTTGGEWHDFAASTTGQTVQSVYMNGAPKVWLAQYNEPTDTRTYITSLSTPMPPGAGFEMWVEAGYNATFNFEGPLLTSDLTLNSGTTPPLSFTDPAHGYNLIGNPFASPLDWDIGTWNLTGVEATIWVWDPSSGSYKDRVGGIGSLTDGIIPIAQGFFVHATASSASVTIPMDARVHSTQAYYKKVPVDVPDHFSIKAVQGERSDELNIVFAEDASTEYDNGRDARKMFAINGDAPQIYSLQSNELLSINGLPVLTEKGRIVQLHYRTGHSGEQTLIANTAFLPGTEVLLEDLFTGKVQDLTENPVYVFQSLEDSERDRFLLHFNLTVTGFHNQKDDNGVYIYAYDGVVYIRSEGKAIKEQKEIVITDLLGRTLVQTTLPSSSLSKIPLLHSNKYLIVKIRNESGVKTAKVFIR